MAPWRETSDVRVISTNRGGRIERERDVIVFVAKEPKACARAREQNCPGIEESYTESNFLIRITWSSEKMSGIVRNALRSGAMKNLVNSPIVGMKSTQGVQNQINRSIWNMCNRTGNDIAAATAPLTTLKIHNPSSLCNCGSCKGAHTKGKNSTSYLEHYHWLFRCIATEILRNLFTLDTHELFLFSS